MFDFGNLNDRQLEAVKCTEGPLLIIAGAGSGKTRVLTHRIAYLIEEKNVRPWNIMALTFTNKAAGEMRERVNKIIKEGAEEIWVSTFHSSCVKILRRYIDRLGYEKSFTIYDSDDQKAIIKAILKDYNIDPKNLPVKAISAEISRAKDKLIDSEMYAINARGDFRKETIARIYKEYHKRLFAANALDFDDLIMKTVLLFQTCLDVLDYYTDKFRYIMIDEYQDTNDAQYELIKLLARHKNLCVVGDDDQSIYKFRGANIQNILNFESDFEGARVIKLEENYRSTKKIIATANALIANNTQRKIKELWTGNEEGEEVLCNSLKSSYAEAEFIACEIKKLTKEEAFEYNDIALLYRTNAQSRGLEEALIYSGIPYKVIGGTNFYSRKEIKDILAYLKTIDNAKDDLAVKRIINVPRRGIGASSIDKLEEQAMIYDISFYDMLVQASTNSQDARLSKKLDKFTDLIGVYRAKMKLMNISDATRELLDEIGYLKELELEGTEEAKGRIENIDEFINKIIAFEEQAEEKTLSAFLQEVALVADIDNLDQDAAVVSLMTLHSAKGLEYPVVFLTGFEEGIFPGYMAMDSEDDSDMEEERRLCYVGITRAQKKLYITSARERMIHGETRYNLPSRFIDELPADYIKKIGTKIEKKIDFSIEPASKKMMGEPPIKLEKYSSMKNVPTDIDYQVGDAVKHIKFGVGVVVDIEPVDKDFSVSIDFDNWGIKKLKASFAKLIKI